MGSGSEPVDPGKSVGAGLQAYLKELPKLLEAEQNARTRYDPQRIEHQRSLYDTYDPNYNRIRDKMGANVLNGVENGYKLPSDFRTELEQEIRGSQAARGNTYGNAPISAEAVYKGRNAIDLYNRNLANAGTFLGMPSPAQPDRTPGYTAGGLQTANTLGLAAYNSQLNQPNPWSAALGGAAQGAAAGASAGGGWGALIGGVVGGAGGYLSSDERLKQDIVYAGRNTADGIPMVRFSYKDMPEKTFIGVLAQDVKTIRPEAVRLDNEGMMLVDYDKLGIKMVEVAR